MKKKNKVELMLMPSPELEHSIEDLADALIENMKHGYHSDLEPFEQYAQKIRINVYENVHEFRSRFVHGYEKLLEEIANEKNEG